MSIRSEVTENWNNRFAVTAEQGQRVARRGPEIITTHLLASILAILAALVGFLAESEGWLDKFHVFLMLAATVLAYSVVQSWLVYSKEGELFYLNPTIHTALIGNLFLFVVGGSVFILPPEFGGFLGEVTYWMVLWMLLYVSGSVALWSGYWSRFSVALVRKLSRSPLLHRVIRPEFRVNSMVLWALFGLGVASQFMLIELGIFGYSQDTAAAATNIGIKQYLAIGIGLIPFTLLV